MIVVDTSALMAILLDEPPADACAAALAGADRLLVSAVTVAEALVVAGARNVGPPMARLLGGAGFEVVAVTAATAARSARGCIRPASTSATALPMRGPPSMPPRCCS